MKKLRLLFTADCNRNCKMCCNKNWDFSTLPNFDIIDIIDTTMYDEILITGGEPLLYPDELYQLCEDIKVWNPKSVIYVYTAFTKLWSLRKLELFDVVDGFTITIHDQQAAKDFYSTELIMRVHSKDYAGKSMRLNIFQNCIPKMHGTSTSPWIIKDNLSWIKDCPLPPNEIFMRFNNY